MNTKTIQKRAYDENERPTEYIASESLVALLRFYRAFGFSFSGVRFEAENQRRKDETTKPRNTKATRLAWNTTGGAGGKEEFIKNKANSKNSFFKDKNLITWALVLNLVNIGVYSLPFVQSFVSNWMLRDKDPKSSSTGGASTSLNFVQYFANQANDARQVAEFDFKGLKPILRSVLQWLVALLFADGMLSFAYCLLYGGRLVRTLAALSRVEDRCKHGHYKVGSAVLLGSVGIMLAGILAFNPDRLSAFVRVGEESNGGGSGGGGGGYHVLWLRAWKTAIHLLHYICLGCQSALFFVTMRLVSSRLDRLRAEIVLDSSKFQERDLVRLKGEVAELREHYRGILGYFFFPITVVLSMSTFALIGSSCYLMISTDRSYSAFIASTGLFALARLCAVCIAGNFPSNAYGQLLRATFERISADQQWTTEVWQHFRELRRSGPSFRTSFAGGAFTVHQGAILAVVGFSLNYTVVLLQTERAIVGATGGGGEK